MEYSERQPREILIFALLIAILLILTLLYQSRHMILGVETSINEESETYVSILTSDKISDQSWGSFAYRGQMKMEEHYPVHTSLHSELTSEASITETAIDVIDEGAELLIGHGREFSDSFTNLAEEYSSVMFVTIHGESTHENQAVYTFDHSAMEFFAALAASLKSDTEKIGVIEPISDDGYAEFFKGINYYNSQATIYRKTAQSRDDGSEAAHIAKEMIEQGVDVIYTKGNAYNQNVIEHAKKEDIYVIGFMDDQSYMAPEHVLTSVVNDIPQLYVMILKDYFSEDGISSGKHVLTESDEVYLLAPLGPMFTEEEKEFIESEIEKYRLGELSF
jgi:transcriptional activator of comK gene